MFKLVLKKLDDYMDKLDSQAPASFHEDLATEVWRRLQQLHYLYHEIRTKHDRYMELNWREIRRERAIRERLGITSGSITMERSDDSREMEELISNIETFTEAFYYFAERMRKILRAGALPGLTSFDCVGARNVRNHLLEHPEGMSSRIFAQSFGVGGERGPTLKIERDAGQEDVFPDAGLWANANEIRQNLERLLDRLL